LGKHIQGDAHETAFSRKAFASFRKRIDYAEYGGAPLLGLKGTGIVCHGRSNSRAIKNAIFVASELVQNRVNDRIMELLPETIIDSSGQDEAMTESPDGAAS